MPSARYWPLVAIATVALLTAASCSSPATPTRAKPSARPSPQPSPTSSTEANGPERSNDIVLASSFEQPVCGFFRHPRAGCEFGAQGDAEVGPFDPRTGDSSLQLQRLRSSTHTGVIADLPLPAGRAFVGAAHRIPAIPRRAIARGGYIQLMQLSPTDGSVPSWPVEVRLFADRRLGLGLFGNGDDHRSPFVVTDWRAPVDQWFYVVVRVTNGDPATQRMWVYEEGDSDPAAVAKVPLVTRVEWTHAYRTAQKVGGTVPSRVPLLTYHDDFYVATRNLGPLQIGPDGVPLDTSS